MPKLDRNGKTLQKVTATRNGKKFTTHRWKTDASTAPPATPSTVSAPPVTPHAVSALPHPAVGGTKPVDGGIATLHQKFRRSRASVEEAENALSSVLDYMRNEGYSIPPEEKTYIDGELHVEFLEGELTLTVGPDGDMVLERLGRYKTYSMPEGENDVLCETDDPEEIGDALLDFVSEPAT